MKPLHKELKDIRIEKGVTLDEIYRATKIRIPFLEKIEEGDFSVVPEPFMRAFLREYAEAVGVDPERVISKYAGKSASIRDEDFWKHEKAKPGETNGNSPSNPGISVSNPPDERASGKTAVSGKEKKTAAAPSGEPPVAPGRTVAGIISDEPEHVTAAAQSRSFPEDEESKSNRALLFGIFAVVIIAATLVILYLNGIIAF